MRHLTKLLTSTGILWKVFSVLQLHNLKTFEKWQLIERKAKLSNKWTLHNHFNCIAKHNTINRTNLSLEADLLCFCSLSLDCDLRCLLSCSLSLSLDWDRRCLLSLSWDVDLLCLSRDVERLCRSLEVDLLLLFLSSSLLLNSSLLSSFLRRLSSISIGEQVWNKDR